MPDSQLFRLSGLAAMIGGSLLIPALILDEVSHRTGGHTSDFAMPSMTLTMVAYMLIGLALIGLYTFQSKAVGKLGFIGFLMAFTGQTLFLGDLYTSAFCLPSLTSQVPEVAEVNSTPLLAAFLTALGLMVVGYVLFGIATFRARILPRRGALLFTVGAVLIMFPAFFSVALVWLGRALWSIKGETTMLPELPEATA